VGSRRAMVEEASGEVALAAEYALALYMGFGCAGVRRYAERCGETGRRDARSRYVATNCAGVWKELAKRHCAATAVSKRERRGTFGDGETQVSLIRAVRGS
jgi:hypothetical protein